jgi:RNA polymerase sigma-70 factor (ECF subfamily)
MPLFARAVLPFTLFRSPRGAAEDALVVRVRQGEPDAIAELYRAHHESVRAFARRLLADESAAEDLVQEVFVTLPAAMRHFEGRSAIRTFLLSIAANHARHHLRALARRRAALEKVAVEPLPPSPCPEADMRRVRLKRALVRALDELPPDQRIAFVLCEVEERSAVEAARIVGAPEATVRTRVFHAKRKLRDILEREAIE